MDLESAIKAHGEWKMKFRAAITGKQQLDAASIARDDACPLGKWLNGQSGDFAGMKSYAKCVADHTAFHTEAGKVAKSINAARYAEAEAMLASGTAYSNASNAVATAIIGLRKEAHA